MSGLVLSLKANERFLVNGAMIKNGPKRGQICVEDNGVHVLRMSDVIHPTAANTPVKKVYYLIQLILSCDQPADSVNRAINAGLDSLEDVFENTPASAYIEKAKTALAQSRYYSALCSLRAAQETEAVLLARLASKTAPYGQADDSHARSQTATASA